MVQTAIKSKSVHNASHAVFANSKSKVSAGKFTNSGQAGFSTDISLAGLVNFLNNDQNKFVTLMMAHVHDTRDTLFYFGSKESNRYSRTSSTTVAVGSLAPQLILQGEDVRFIPEPTSLLLLILGVLLYFNKNKLK